LKTLWPIERIRELHEYCKRYGLLAATKHYGINTGRVHDLVRRLSEPKRKDGGHA
jgi:hypothetical protein